MSGGRCRKSGFRAKVESPTDSSATAGIRYIFKIVTFELKKKTHMNTTISQLRIHFLKSETVWEGLVKITMTQPQFRGSGHSRGHRKVLSVCGRSRCQGGASSALGSEQRGCSRTMSTALQQNAPRKDTRTV